MYDFKVISLQKAGEQQGRSFLGSGRIKYPEERAVAAILTAWQYPWRYEPTTLWDPDSGEVRRGAKSDFQLQDEGGEWSLVLEVKRKHREVPYARQLARFLQRRLGRGHFGYRQAELALRAGCGFAYITTGSSDPPLDMLRPKVSRAIDEALQIRDLARRTFPDWQRVRAHQEEHLSHLLIPIPRSVRSVGATA